MTPALATDPCDDCGADTPRSDLERCEKCAAYVCRDCMGEKSTCTRCQEAKR